MAENKVNIKSKKFSSATGFIFACIGSAVGLGNIWLFPYRLGQYGGAAFLIPYFIFVAIFGYVGLSGEFAMGRKAGTGTLGAYKLCWRDKKFSKIGDGMGWTALIGSLGIAIGYAVILGWVLRSLWGSISGSMFSMKSTEYFAQAAGSFGSISYHIIIIALVMFILLVGAANSIEKVNKLLISVFFVLFILLAVRIAFLPGAVEGYKFLFIPKWSQLLNVNTWIMAMGQAFFTLSITGSGMMTYGSYLSKEEDIVRASLLTAVFDTLAAIVCALAIMPAVFAFGIKPNAGPSLMFITLPEVFKKIAFGNVVSVIFFLSVLFAGITSLMNMFEAVIESVQSTFNIKRKAAVVLCAVMCAAVGVFIENEASVGVFMDIVTIGIVPLGAVFGAISIYYVLGKGRIEEEINCGREKKVTALFSKTARYVYVPLTVVILVLGVIYKGIG